MNSQPVVYKKEDPKKLIQNILLLAERVIAEVDAGEIELVESYVIDHKLYIKVGEGGIFIVAPLQNDVFLSHPTDMIPPPYRGPIQVLYYLQLYLASLVSVE